MPKPTSRQRLSPKRRPSKSIPRTTVIIFLAVLVATSLLLLLLRLSSSYNDNLELTNFFTVSGSSLETTAIPKTTDASTMMNYSLAYQQSLGYFDDIPNHQWMRAQEIHSKMFPNHFESNLYKFSSGTDNKDPKFMKQVKLANKWYGNSFHPEFHCPLAQRLPTDGYIDGPKWICDPHRLRNVSNCLIYSFGSNGKAEFEMGIQDETYRNCEIHTFDPVSSNKRNGDFATALKGYATFHNWGLGTPDDPNPKMKTLQQTMQELGHVGRTIHIFKIDCEWCEWFTYRQWLEEDIRQILVETHNAPMPHSKRFFYELHDAGFMIFSKEANYDNGAGAVEYGFVKLSIDFLRGNLYAKQ